MLTVREYAARDFLNGWLWAPVFFSLCLISAPPVPIASGPNDSKLIKLLPSHTNKKFKKVIKTIAEKSFYVVAQVGVTCYPIYLFQLTDRYLGLNLHWSVSLLWALGFGIAVHEAVEKRFYRFPSYTDIVFSYQKPHDHPVKKN